MSNTTDNWKEVNRAFNRVTAYVLEDGTEIKRTRYGLEHFGGMESAESGQPCHDCSAQIGMFHVIGCDTEECPNCQLQAIGCDCPIQSIVMTNVTEEQRKLISQHV